jgi:putative transposase
MIASTYIDQGYPARKVLSFLNLSASVFYYRIPANTGLKKKGIKPSATTLTLSGEVVSNDVILGKIKALLQLEFVDYGYIKVYHFLKEQYKINHKKVYQLMKKNKLMRTPKQVKIGTKNWVKELVPEPTVAFTYWEFDIKFMYVQGLGKYIPLLSVIDVKSRWLLGHLCQASIKKEDVKTFMETLTSVYIMPNKIQVRCDNGSQFESNLIREYFASKDIYQEFTKPATPEQNAHIESYHSILEKVICRQYLFETAQDQLNTLNRWVLFYNYKRIHSGTMYMSPYNALLTNNIDVYEKFTKPIIENKSIFVGLKEKEACNAEVQNARDSLADRNKQLTQSK